MVYSFGQFSTDAGFPAAGLLDVNGTLYGTTVGGGAYNSGTVFAVNPSTGTEEIVYSFHGDTDGATDGASPAASLIEVGGLLYGTTPGGGGPSPTNCPFECGTVFSVNPATGSEKVIYSFGESSADGTKPYASLLDVEGTLYGTTSKGGSTNCSGGCGTVFSVSASGEQVEHSFSGADGADPLASLIDVGGALYGTTNSGGTSNGGTVFSLSPTNDEETVIFNFTDNKTGTAPQAAVINLGKRLYGTTAGGGVSARREGTVFALVP